MTPLECSVSVGQPGDDGAVAVVELVEGVVYLVDYPEAIVGGLESVGLGPRGYPPIPDLVHSLCTSLLVAPACSWDAVWAPSVAADNVGGLMPVIAISSGVTMPPESTMLMAC